MSLDRERIIAAIEYYHPYLYPGRFGVHYTGGKWNLVGPCCALGCVILKEQPSFLGDVWRTACYLMNWTIEEVIDFSAGFDGEIRSISSEKYKLGQEIRKLYL